jgi:hypothetical protein
MKKLNLLIIIALMLGLYSCSNDEWEFPDFDYTTVYFPYQYPVRTLVLGDYIYDNENDNDLKFLISPRIGGMYENTKDWKINFQVANELVDSLYSPVEHKLLALPTKYYTLNPTNEVILPKGQFNAGIEVQLTEEFLNDSLSVDLNYVIPIKIISSTADSVLTGLPSTSFENPDPRVASDWKITPKHYTLFGIKYVNKYHGKYLVRGKSVIKNMLDAEIETFVYRKKYVEQDQIWFLKTKSKNKVLLEGRDLNSNLDDVTGKYSLEITFAEGDNTCTVTNTLNSQFAINGTGKFVKDGDEWGNKKRDVIHLSYEINDGKYIHSVSDTLVFRDKAIVFEQFEPIIVKN